MSKMMVLMSCMLFQAAFFLGAASSEPVGAPVTADKAPAPPMLFQRVGWAGCLALSPDRQTLLIGDGYGIQGWSMERRRIEFSVPNFEDQTVGLAWSPDGHQFAALEMNGSLRVFDAVLRTPIAVLPDIDKLPPGSSAGLTVEKRPLAWSADGKWISAVSRSDGAWLIDARKFSVERSLPGHGAMVGAVAFSPDSRLLATGGASGQVLIWSLPGGVLRQSLKTTSAVRALAWSPDGRLLIAGLAAAPTEADTVPKAHYMLWDNAASQPRPIPSSGDCDETPSVVGFTGDGDRFFVESGTDVLVGSVAGAEPPKKLKMDYAYDFLLLPDGDTLLNNQMQALNLRTGQSSEWLRKFPDVRTHLSPDGKALLAVTGTGFAVWDTATMKPGKVISTTGRISNITASPDTALLVANRYDEKNEVMVWATRSGTVVQQWPKREGYSPNPDYARNA